jgi:hypothetical protein
MRKSTDEVVGSYTGLQAALVSKEHPVVVTGVPGVILLAHWLSACAS